MFAAGLLIAAGMQVTGVPSAHAVCGLEDEYTFPITPGWGLEEGYGDPQCGAFGTVYPYGNDGHYRGRVRDLVSDGSCVSVRYTDNNYNALQASSCSTSGTVYHYYDGSGTAAFVRLERNQGVSPYVLSRGY